MIKRLSLAVALLVGLPTSSWAACTGQFQSGQVCGNATAGTHDPTGTALSPLLDSAFGAPSAQGTILNRGASLWSATTTPVLGNPGSTTGTLSLSSSIGGTAILSPPAIAGNTSLQLPTLSGTVPSTAASPLAINSITGVLSCPGCTTSLVVNSTPVSGAAAGRVLFSDGSLLQAYPITGTTNVVLSNSPTFTGTPALAAPTANTLAVGGATLGGNAFAVTGTSLFNNAVQVNDGVTATTAVTVPTVAGGTLASSTLTLEGTSGVGTTDAIRFVTGNQIEAARFTSNQRLLIGATTPQTIVNELAAVQVSSVLQEQAAFLRFNSGSIGANITVGASRGAAPGTFSATQTGDNLGAFIVYGDTGAGYSGSVTNINSTAEGTFTPTSTPARLEFRTVSSGSTTPTERLRITSTAHFEYNHGSGTPTLTACGTGPTISGTDTAGQITTGTTATGCTVTFAVAWAASPYCTVSWATNLASMVYTVSTAAITITQTSTSNNTIFYHCFR